MGSDGGLVFWARRYAIAPGRFRMSWTPPPAPFHFPFLSLPFPLPFPFPSPFPKVSRPAKLALGGKSARGVPTQSLVFSGINKSPYAYGFRWRVGFWARRYAFAPGPFCRPWNFPLPIHRPFSFQFPPLPLSQSFKTCETCLREKVRGAFLLNLVYLTE